MFFQILTLHCGVTEGFMEAIMIYIKTFDVEKERVTNTPIKKYLLKVNNRNTRNKFETFPKLTVKTGYLC